MNCVSPLYWGLWGARLALKHPKPHKKIPEKQRLCLTPCWESGGRWEGVKRHLGGGKALRTGFMGSQTGLGWEAP